MSDLAVGDRVRSASGWIGEVVAVGAPPRGYIPRHMRSFGDRGETVWIDWGDHILSDHLLHPGRKAAYGYAMSVIEKLERIDGETATGR